MNFIWILFAIIGIIFIIFYSIWIGIPRLFDYIVEIHHRELIKPKREEFFHIRREFIKYLMQKDFNEEEAKRILDDTLKKQIQLEKMMGKHLIELRKNLDYEKARNFFRRHCFEKHKLPIRRKK